jgi:hypothetical protein
MRDRIKKIVYNERWIIKKIVNNERWIIKKKIVNNEI